MSKKNFSSKFLTAGAVFAAAALGFKKLREQKNQQTAETPDAEETTPETAAAQEVEIVEAAAPVEEAENETAETPVEEEAPAAAEESEKDVEAEKDNGITK